jgi:hypothetical protein
MECVVCCVWCVSNESNGYERTPVILCDHFAIDITCWPSLLINVMLHIILGKCVTLYMLVLARKYLLSGYKALYRTIERLMNKEVASFCSTEQKKLLLRARGFKSYCKSFNLVYMAYALTMI